MRQVADPPKPGAKRVLAFYAPPPTGWEPALAKLARARSGRLAKLAEQLERKA